MRPFSTICSRGTQSEKICTSKLSFTYMNDMFGAKKDPKSVANILGIGMNFALINVAHVKHT